jgi:hypothetical protein
MRRRRRRRVLLVGGLLAFGAYKLSKRDADRIQQDTGTNPEDMTDEELESSMDRLGIEKQYRDAADQEQTAAAAPADDGMSSVIDDLERLAKLNSEGVLTDEEFAAKKRELLNEE